MNGWSLATRPGVPGGVAIIELLADTPAALDAMVAQLGLGRVAPGACALRDLMGIDRGIVARWEGRSASLMPHGGPAVVRAIASELTSRGVPPIETGPPDSDDAARALFPEARNAIEARALAALGAAASARAVDLLLCQHDLWMRAERDPAFAPDAERDRALRHVLEPPMVAAVGLANIGKSSLLNALADRSVATVEDRAGTTRDAVGAEIELDGLIVRWIDTPGRAGDGEASADAPANEPDRAAADLAELALARADLVLLCFDAPQPGPGARERAFVARAAPKAKMLEVALRLDRRASLSDNPLPPGVLGVSATRGEGLAELAREVRRTLVPDRALSARRAWRFWQGPPG